MGKIIMLSYLAMGLLIILFNILGLYDVALVTFGIMIAGTFTMLGINWYIKIKKMIKKLKK